jgi:hypothetical protein
MNSTEPTPHNHAPAEHQREGSPDPAVIKRGYEEDRYDSTSVLSVPIIVVVFFVLAFGVVTIMFQYLAPTPNDPEAHPQAVERNSASLNERLDRIRRGGEVNQPRLEPLKLRSGDARAITRPELPTGNSPEYHPEDLRPSPSNTPDLYVWQPLNPGQARISIEEAMNLAVNTKLSEKLLPARKDGKRPAQSYEKPTVANAGRGSLAQGSLAQMVDHDH